MSIISQKEFLFHIFSCVVCVGGEEREGGIKGGGAGKGARRRGGRASLILQHGLSV